MRVSAKIDYASRVLAQMAMMFSTEEWLRIEDLARREAVSANYLIQILNDLKQAG